MKPQKRMFKSQRRALILSGVLNVCTLSWIFYSGLYQPSVHIVVPYQQEDVPQYTMAERLEEMGKCDLEVLKEVLASNTSDDLEEKTAAAYLLLQKRVQEVKAVPQEVIAVNEPPPPPQVVRPPRKQPAQNINLYLVQQGDSLWKIARKHQTDVNTLKQLNSLEGDSLRAGKIIKLPS